jgi:hypothetical protein
MFLSLLVTPQCSRNLSVLFRQSKVGQVRGKAKVALRNLVPTGYLKGTCGSSHLPEAVNCILNDFFGEHRSCGLAAELEYPTCIVRIVDPDLSSVSLDPNDWYCG